MRIAAGLNMLLCVYALTCGADLWTADADWRDSLAVDDEGKEVRAK